MTDAFDVRRTKMAVSAATKRMIRRTLDPLGLELVRRSPQTSPEMALVRMLTHHGIDAVLDVGANEGQYALLLRKLGFHGQIISFEPLTAAHRSLQRSATNDPLWIIAPRMAVGDCEGQVRVNVASESVASSVLPMSRELEEAAPQLGYSGSEVVPIARLDRASRDLLSEGQRIFLKVDVQGYESHVLRGATELLLKVIGVQLEVSFVALYEGQALYSTLFAFIEKQGFSVWGFVPGLMNQSSGRLLQADVIFFRE